MSRLRFRPAPDASAVAAAATADAVITRNALFNVGLEQLTGRPSMRKVALDNLEQSGEMGHVGALRTLAEYFDEGKKEVWKKRAAEYFAKAAELGDASSQNSLGVCLQNGTGVAKDEARAVAMYRAAVGQNHLEAMCNLAFCYDQGIGDLAVDKCAAYALFMRAADDGHGDGSFYVAWCLRDGDGVDVDTAQSAVYLKRAYAQGCTLVLPPLQKK